jgi:ubiquinone/menaquinone biosynthesis C-methylase UbiE
MKLINWEDKFNEELVWTTSLRDHLYEKAEVGLKNNLLEIGCGKGELLKELGIKFNLKLFGLDKNDALIEFARDNLQKNLIEAKLMNMDILNNNLESKFFDIIITHYSFLWIKDLDRAIQEIHRILTADGVFLILGEPDFDGLIEYPDTNLKNQIYSALKKVGADPEVGKKLIQYFYNKFRIVEQYCSSVPITPIISKQRLYKELEFYLKVLNLKKFKFELMKKSIDNRTYFLFIPVFTYILKKV